MPLPDPEALVRAMADAMRGKIAPDAGLVGIFTGGAWVAERLHRALEEAGHASELLLLEGAPHAFQIDWRGDANQRANRAMDEFLTRVM